VVHILTAVLHIVNEMFGEHFYTVRGFYFEKSRNVVVESVLRLLRFVSSSRSSCEHGDEPSDIIS
jgi:hypothetical protein